MLDYRTHTFLEVYRQGSFTLAAKALMITQPAVTQHIKHLEAHYGCSLFTKTGRGIEPTSAAHMLYQRLLTMENDERRMCSEARELSDGKDPKKCAPLIFGCTRTIANCVAPRLIPAYVAQHPESPVSLRAGNTRDLVDALENGDIDFALVEGSFDRDRFAYEVLSHERYIAVSSAGVRDGLRDGALAEAQSEPREATISPDTSSSYSPGAKNTSIRDLMGERLILREAGSGTREILEKHLAARDLAISDFAGAIELESIPTIKECVRSGAGITFLYRVAVQHELELGELIDITPRDFEIEHDFCLIWQRGSKYAARYRSICASWRKELAQEPAM